MHDIEIIVRARTARGSRSAATVAGEIAEHLAGMPGGLDVTLSGADFPSTAGGGKDGLRRRLHDLRGLLGVEAQVFVEDEVE